MCSNISRSVSSSPLITLNFSQQGFDTFNHKKA